MSFNQPLPNKPYRTHQLVGINGGSVAELTLAKEELKKFVTGERKTKPSKKMLDVLEKNGVISKTGAGMPPNRITQRGGVNRLNKAERWSTFAKENIVKDGIDLAAYGYDKYNQAVNPVTYAVTKKVTGAKPATYEGSGVNRLRKGKRWSTFSKENIVRDGIDLAAYGYDKYNEAVNPITSAVSDRISGGSVHGKREPSAWIKFVKSYASKHGMKYGDALKAAGAEYKKMVGKGYQSIGAGYSSIN